MRGLGLRRADLDLESASVNIERPAVEIIRRRIVEQAAPDRCGRAVGRPAGSGSVPELVHHLDTFAEPGPDGRMFLGAYGATPFRRNFTHDLETGEAGGRGAGGLHVHDLRHAGNHFAAVSGASTRELMGRMGHVSMRAALIY
jgi:integrase